MERLHNIRLIGGLSHLDFLQIQFIISRILWHHRWHELNSNNLWIGMEPPGVWKIWQQQRSVSSKRPCSQAPSRRTWPHEAAARRTWPRPSRQKFHISVPLPRFSMPSRSPMRHSAVTSRFPISTCIFSTSLTTPDLLIVEDAASEVESVITRLCLAGFLWLPLFPVASDVFTLVQLLLLHLWQHLLSLPNRVVE